MSRIEGSECSSARILCLVGKSGAGKTMLIERLIRYYVRHGVRVGAIKRTHHAVPLDVPGKDSWRMGRAGARRVLLDGPHGAMLIDYRPREDRSWPSIQGLFADCDLVLVEGNAGDDYDKVVVAQRWEDAWITPRTVAVVLAEIPSPRPTEVPTYHREEVEPLARHLLAGYIPVNGGRAAAPEGTAGPTLGEDLARFTR